MDDSQPDSKIFSVRIVSIDYYMSPPIPGLDICYSSFQGGNVNEVPVIRVYGSTPAGQKTCLHIHRALPYLYVPCSDIVDQPDQEGDACVQVICHALEKALKLKGSAGSKRQHVHGCSLVSAKRFYGYDTSEQRYAKLYLYHPQDVSRASKLLLDGSVLEKSLQPHESHIPFLLQFLVDYNLQGMGHLHVSKMKFRYPVPRVFTKKLSYNGQHKQQMDNSFPATNKADLSGDVSLKQPIWLSSTIPDTWMWHFPSQDPEDNIGKRQSVCELEGDAAIDDILNQQCKLYSSLSQTLSDVRMVQSLIPIWEEFERTGIHMETISSDPEKPSPHTVLSALSNQVEFENKLLELCKAGDSSPCTPVNTGQMLSKSVRSQSHYSAEDSEALRLLNWLASSQAAEDINSDDELKRETILSPLIPTISKVLEKADMEFTSASQQECQDILDSVQDAPDGLECKTTSETSAAALDCNYSSPQSSSKEEIPQVDSKKRIHHTRKTSQIQKNKGKRPLWGSLPLCSTENVNDSEKDIGTVNGAGSTIVGCSVRDLMRRKRCHRGESPKGEIHSYVKVTPDKESKENIILFPSQMSDHQNVSPISTNLTDGPTAVGSSPTLTPGSGGNKAEEICQFEDKDMDGCAPLDGESQEVKHAKSKPDDSMSHQEQSMDTSTHYRDDGSHVYMLTPAILPPSTDEVNKWLLHNETGTALKEEYLSPKGSLEPLVDSSSVSAIKTNLDHAEKIGQENHATRPKTCSPGLLSVPQGVSQLSGPEGKKLTPLSQAGFKDPASIGAGQQLTMFCIEVQSESRGDLRPDPRFDAINFIVVVIAEDDESAISSYVILRIEMESVRRNIDGISDCTLIVCNQERQLFIEFMKIISSHDPDILMGWDIQGGSLGFLAERAAFLGIGLLNKISRTPSQPILNPGVSDILDKVPTGDVLLEPVDSQTDVLNEAIIEDEWGRTHASGVHVGGRIVLNVWRLVRSEVKVNIYTAEAVAEAVLRRKIPFINFRTLTKWFASGPGKARYRCIEYILERGKLNFQVMNQLDMINRTSELARVFGIDFFSVLSRGSQYRVESIERQLDRNHKSRTREEQTIGLILIA